MPIETSRQIARIRGDALERCLVSKGTRSVSGAAFRLRDVSDDNPRIRHEDDESPASRMGSFDHVARAVLTRSYRSIDRDTA